MLAQLKTLVLIKEAIKLALFRLVEYLTHQWVRLQAQNGQKTKSFLLKLVSHVTCAPSPASRSLGCSLWRTAVTIVTCSSAFLHLPGLHYLLDYLLLFLDLYYVPFYFIKTCFPTLSAHLYRMTPHQREASVIPLPQRVQQFPLSQLARRISIPQRVR